MVLRISWCDVPCHDCALHNIGQISFYSNTGMGFPNYALTIPVGYDKGLIFDKILKSVFPIQIIFFLVIIIFN